MVPSLPVFPVEELPDSRLAGATWLARLPHETASEGAVLALVSATMLVLAA